MFCINCGTKLPDNANFCASCGTKTVASTVIADNQNPEGTFTDPRDGKTYLTVKIGKQVWMAENLNFECEGSVCYDNNPEYAEIFGRLYDWDTAMEVCPPGWHLPSYEEWNELVDFAGGEDTAGNKLKAKSGWSENGNGTDEYGFSALPGGVGNSDGRFGLVGSGGLWWSATEDGSLSAYGRIVGDGAGGSSLTKSQLFSVRCVQD